jgi:hypothetical protein
MGSFFSTCKSSGCKNKSTNKQEPDPALIAVDVNEKTYLKYIMNYDSIPYFIPKIKFAKVTDIRENYTIVVAARFPYKTSPIYRFPVKLKHTDNWRQGSILHCKARDALFPFICSNIVELLNIEYKDGILQAEVYYGKKNVTEWLMDNNLAIDVDNETPFIKQVYNMREDCIALDDLLLG